METALDALKILVCWQMIAGALFVQVIMQTLARVTNLLAPKAREVTWFRIFVASQNIVWGLIIAFSSNFLPGKTFFERAVLGVVAGSVSHLVYKFFLNKFAITNTKPAPKGESDGAS